MVAAAENDMAGRPALVVGTDKQIAWAETLRAEFLIEADDYLAALTANPPTEEDGQETARLYGIWHAEITAQTSAQWWIDHQREPLDDVIAGHNPMAIFNAAMTGRTPKTDVISLFRTWVRERRVAEKIAAIPKPQRPDFMAAWPSPWTWNGQIYGNPKYGPVRIYLRHGDGRDGIEYKISGEHAEALKSYMAAKKTYNEACKTLPAQQIEAEDKTRAARVAKAHEVRQAALAAPLNAIVDHAADIITEADCTFDAYGNWTGATVDGHTFGHGFYANEVGDIDGSRNAGPALMARADSREIIGRLQDRIGEIAASRRDGLENLTRQADMDMIQRGHVATVERTRKQSGNTTIVLDNGFTIHAHVATKRDSWPDCLAARARAYYGLSDDLHRLGTEAEQIYRQQER
jgi:hypothetical protein